MGEHNPTGYSASVRIWLVAGDRKIPLSHSSSTFVIAKAPVELPAGDASIVFTIDDEEFTRPITLPNGMTLASREAVVLSRDSVAPF
jgi:hypothetical protein